MLRPTDRAEEQEIYLPREPPCSVSSLGEFQLALASRQILHVCIPLVLRLEEGMKRHGAVLRVGCRCWSLGTVRDSKVLIGVYC